jgi:signal transduction histidine kinase
MTDRRSEVGSGRWLAAWRRPVSGHAGPTESLGWTIALIAATMALYIVLKHVLYAAIGSVNGGPPMDLHGFASRFGDDFPSYFAAGLLMLAVIGPVRRLGPDGGWRRVVAVAAGVVVATMAASAFWMTVWALGAELADRDRDPLLDLFVAYLPRFLAIGALLTAVGEFYRGEVRSLEAMRAAEADRTVLEQQTLQARLRTLEAQIEPHFLFNTLANVRRLYETDHATGEAMLERLMRYLQVALPSMRDDRSTLEREGQLIAAYLQLQQVRMGRRLEFDIDIAPALQQVEVPPMMLLTLVENAIKHGLAPQREGGRVEVAARQEGDRIRLEVADTGRGFGGDTAGGGTGLANIRARLAAMFGSAGEFTLAARQPCGLLATIRIPVTVRAVAA